MFFTSKELKAFSQSYREARAEYNESQQDLVRNIQQIASTYAPVFELIEEALAEIDALLSLAHASVRPFPLLALLSFFRTFAATVCPASTGIDARSGQLITVRSTGMC